MRDLCDRQLMKLHGIRNWSRGHLWDGITTLMDLGDLGSGIGNLRMSKLSPNPLEYNLTTNRIIIPRLEIYALCVQNGNAL